MCPFPVFQIYTSYNFPQTPRKYLLTYFFLFVSFAFPSACKSERENLTKVRLKQRMSRVVFNIPNRKLSFNRVSFSDGSILSQSKYFFKARTRGKIMHFTLFFFAVSHTLFPLSFVRLFCSHSYFNNLKIGKGDES